MGRALFINSEIEQIAKVCHNVNKAYCETEGDYSQPEWNDAPDWQKESAINGVGFHLSNDVTPEQSHINWYEEKINDGWVWGDVKDPENKRHPCLIPYELLPEFQKNKDLLFKTIVDSYK